MVREGMSVSRLNVVGILRQHAGGNRYSNSIMDKAVLFRIMSPLMLSLLCFSHESIRLEDQLWQLRKLSQSSLAFSVHPPIQRLR